MTLNDIKQAMANLEGVLLLQSLRAHKYNQGQTAKTLQTSVTQLRRLIARHPVVQKLVGKHGLPPGCPKLEDRLEK